MDAVTRLGDAAITMPLAVVLFAALFTVQRGTAWRWAAAVVCCGLVTASGKVGLALWGDRSAELLSPSGHTAASVLVYGAMALLCRNLLAAGAAAVLVAGIAASRIYLDLHTPADVVAGLVIGTASLAWFGPARPILPGWALRAGAVACAAVCFAGAVSGWSVALAPWRRLAAARRGGG